MKRSKTFLSNKLLLFSLMVFLPFAGIAQQKITAADQIDVEEFAANVIHHYQILLNNLAKEGIPVSKKRIEKERSYTETPKQIFYTKSAQIEMDLLNEEFNNGSGTYVDVKDYLGKFELFVEKGNQYKVRITIKSVTKLDMEVYHFIRVKFELEILGTDTEGNYYGKTEKVAEIRADKPDVSRDWKVYINSVVHHRPEDEAKYQWYDPGEAHKQMKAKAVAQSPTMASSTPIFSEQPKPNFNENSAVGIDAGKNIDKDTDKDGTLDEDDACPLVFGPKNYSGCPDRDDDGIPDVMDKCPNEKGLLSSEGCPKKNLDEDNDGVLDGQDECPNYAGPPATNGCPDRDGDGVLDKDDNCVNEAGDLAYQGCPWVEKPLREQAGVNWFSRRSFLAINHQFLKGNSENFNFKGSNIGENFSPLQVEKFGFSYYAPLGFFISNYKNTEDNKPSVGFANEVPSIYKDKAIAKSNMSAFNVGIYIAPAYKRKGLNAFHIMLGYSSRTGEEWKEYVDSGNLLVADYKSYKDEIGFVAGLAFVLPFLQVEFGMDTNETQFFFNGGVNIPFSVFSNRH